MANQHARLEPCRDLDPAARDDVLDPKRRAPDLGDRGTNRDGVIKEERQAEAGAARSKPVVATSNQT